MDSYLGSIIKKINNLVERSEKPVKIMEVCGGHTHLIYNYGLKELLNKKISLVSGPGCPVCVTTQKDIDSIIKISEHAPVATYGDMMRVPGTELDLDTARSQGRKIFEVYSSTEALELSKKSRDLVFFGIGFETTAPMTAYLLKNKVTVYSCHKLIPPALKIISDSTDVDGFINPGHVSTIIGIKDYKEIDMPQVISGFTIEGFLKSILVLVEMISEKKKGVINLYPEVVNEHGNPAALRILKEQFIVNNGEWRGLGVINNSSLEPRDDKLNAKIKYSNLLENVKSKENKLCRCGEVIMGKIVPKECEIYKKICTPKNPIGPCMVSSEGACAISYAFENG